MSNKICIAVITNAHGINGCLRVKSFGHDSTALTDYGKLMDASGKKTFDLTITGQSKGQFIVKIDGVNNRNDAEALKATELFIMRDKLPDINDDEFYYTDLIGMRMETSDNSHYGTLKAVHDFGAGDLLDVNLAAGGSIMLPFTKEVIIHIDMKAGLLIVNPPLEIEIDDAKLIKNVTLENKIQENEGGSL